jgi:hypothetical protein
VSSGEDSVNCEDIRIPFYKTLRKDYLQLIIYSVYCYFFDLPKLYNNK